MYQVDKCIVSHSTGVVLNRMSNNCWRLEECAWLELIICDWLLTGKIKKNSTTTTVVCILESYKLSFRTRISFSRSLDFNSNRKKRKKEEKLKWKSELFVTSKGSFLCVPWTASFLDIVWRRLMRDEKGRILTNYVINKSS